MNTIQKEIAWNTSKDKVLMSAAQYFLSRKKQIERYVEGEHKWYGDTSTPMEYTYCNEPRPWYLDNDSVSKTPVGG